MVKTTTAMILIIVAAVCHALHFVLSLVLYSADSNEFWAIERINWVEVINTIVNPHYVDWCTQFFDRQLCQAMQVDLHLGGVYVGAYFRVSSVNVPRLFSAVNVTKYEDVGCMVPGGDDVCNGCNNASNVIVTFQAFTTIAQLIVGAALVSQMKQGPSLTDRGIIIGTAVAMVLFGIVQVGTFHDQCFRLIPTDIEAMQGSCFVFVSFQIVLAMTIIGLQFALSKSGGTLPKGSIGSILATLSPSVSFARLRTSSRVMTPLMPVQDPKSPSVSMKRKTSFQPLSPTGRTLGTPPNLLPNPSTPGALSNEQNRRSMTLVNQNIPNSPEFKKSPQVASSTRKFPMIGRRHSDVNIEPPNHSATDTTSKVTAKGTMKMDAPTPSQNIDPFKQSSNKSRARPPRAKRKKSKDAFESLGDSILDGL